MSTFFKFQAIIGKAKTKTVDYIVDTASIERIENDRIFLKNDKRLIYLANPELAAAELAVINFPVSRALTGSVSIKQTVNFNAGDDTKIEQSVYHDKSEDWIIVMHAGNELSMSRENWNRLRNLATAAISMEPTS